MMDSNFLFFLFLFNVKLYSLQYPLIYDPIYENASKLNLIFLYHFEILTFAGNS